MPHRIAVIPPIPLTDHERERRLVAYQVAAGPDSVIEVRQLAGGPPLTDREYELFWATAYMILEAEQAERDGADGVLIDCTTDPGLVEMSQSVSVPVVGALEAGLRAVGAILSGGAPPTDLPAPIVDGDTDGPSQVGTARAGSDNVESAGPDRELDPRRARFGLIALDEHWQRMIGTRIAQYRWGEGLVGVEVAGAHVYRPDHAGGLDASESQEMLDRIASAGRRLVEKGASAILLGSTTIIAEREPTETALGVPVIAPGIAALARLEAILDGREPSPVGNFPRPVFRYGDVVRGRLVDGR